MCLDFNPCMDHEFWVDAAQIYNISCQCERTFFPGQFPGRRHTPEVLTMDVPNLHIVGLAMIIESSL